MLLLIESNELDRPFLNQAIKEVFEYRNTHEVPKYLIEYPENWIGKFDRLRNECDIKENLDECFFKISNFLKLPTIVSKENKTKSLNKNPCHFCEQEALIWNSKHPNRSRSINETEETYDYDCQVCGPFRVSGLFAEINNAKQNPKTWKAWSHFLKNREKELLNQRLLITTYHHFF